MLPCRNAGIFFIRRDRLENRGLGIYDDIVADTHMVCHAHLPAQHHVITQPCRPGDAALSHDDTVLADPHIVSDMHEIVQLRAITNRRGTELSSVDTGACPELNAIADRSRTDVRNLDETPPIG